MNYSFALLALLAVAAVGDAELSQAETFAVELADDDECHAAAPVGSGHCAFTALQRRSQVTGVARLQPSAGSGEACHNAVPGEGCWNEVQWAREHGLKDYPQWYPGLDTTSSDAAFQEVVHQSTPGRCPKPCLREGEACHDAVAGEVCWGEVEWAMQQGLKEHPDWYPGLGPTSSRPDFQEVVHKTAPDRCPRPCSPPGSASALPPPGAVPPPGTVPPPETVPPPQAGPPPASMEDVEAVAERGKWCESGPAPMLWPPSASGPRTKVKVLSYNLFWWNLFKKRGGNNHSAGKLIKSTMGAHPYDFMGFQECEEPEKVFAGVGLLEDYKVFLGAHAVCLAYAKNRWTLLAHGLQEVSEDMRSHWYGKRGAQWMRLEHAETKRTVFFVNHHGPLIVNSGGVCGGRATAHNLLKLMAAKAVPGDLIILVGDFNANAASATIQQLWQHLVHVYNGNSWGGVDNIFSNADVGSILNTETLGSGGSDHNAVSATIGVGGRGAEDRAPLVRRPLEPGKAVRDLMRHPPGYDWQDFWCGKLEPEIAYTWPEGVWSAVAKDGRAPDWCCRECQSEPRCKSWMYQLTGNPQCVLVGALPSGKLAKPIALGFVSGLPVRSATTLAHFKKRKSIRAIM